MRVAVVGLGLMGEPIARRLLTAGHDLTVFNRTSERTAPLAADGATVAPSLAEVWTSRTSASRWSRATTLSARSLRKKPVC